MLTVPASALRLRPQTATATSTAWACFWVGIAASYLLVLLRMADLAAAPALAVGFVAFHAGLVAACVAFARGLQPGWATSLLANSFPVGLFWLAVWAIPAFFARFQ